MWDFESFYYVLCKTTSNHLETAWVSSWGSGLSIWIEIVLWKQGILFLEPFKIKGMSGRKWDSESFFYVIQHQIVLKLLEYHPEVVDCQSELKLFCGNGVSFFKDIQNHRHKKWNMRFGELLLCNSTSDCLETAWVSSWGSELSIWIEIVLWKQGVSIFKAIQNHRQKKWNMRFGELLLCNSTSDCLETACVSSWGSELSIWIEIVLWNEGVSFLKPSKIKDRKSGILYLECFYFVIQHQIVLKLLECHPGAVDCQSELKLVCGNREFPF